MSQAKIIDVRENHRFDEARLVDYLSAAIDDFEGPAEVRQFAGGQSNPTFLLTTSVKKFVLRKKPPGKLLPSAHMVEREFRVMKALEETAVPVPNCRVLCEDDSVIGTAFYVMDHIEGRVFHDPALPGETPADRTQIFENVARTLARLHEVQPASVGLGDFAKTGGYVERQVKRWSKQYEASKTDEIPEMESLMRWLNAADAPPDESGIVHGDFRLGNLMLHPTEPEILAVLDWELATLGHPLADLAYTCMSYHMPHGTKDLPGFRGLNLDELGIPSEARFLEIYAEERGQAPVAPEAHRFFMAFSMFRLAAIAQGVYRRGLDGNASDAKAQLYGAAARALAALGWGFAEQG